MARQSYGGGADDIIVTGATISATLVAALPSSQTFQVWNLANSVQLTGIVDGSGVALPSNLVTSTADGQIPVFQGPDGHVGSLRLKHTGTGVSWVVHPHDTGTAIPATVVDAKGDLIAGTAADTATRLAVGSNGQVLTADSTQTTGIKWATPAAGGGASLPNTLVVAASGSGVTGDYTCDGTADNTELAAAVTATGLNGRVLLSAGTFNLAALVPVNGSNNADIEGDLYIQGAGPSNTTLVVAPGVAAAFELSDAVRVHISDLGIQVTGASDGIIATHSPTPAAVYRSAWFSSIERVQVKGPWDGTHTGWGLDLGNVFRFRCANVEVGGTGNGIRMINETADFNAGDATFDRCFVEVDGNNAVAYSVWSTAGNMNQIFFSTCHSIANPANTGTVAWQFGGPGSTSHIRTTNCNVEQFATTVQIAGTAYDVDVDLVHVTLRNGSTLVDLDGYNNRVRCGLAYVEPSATVTLVDDDNTYAAKPNIVGPIDIYADTGSTVNADVADTVVLRDITWDGPGTVAAAVKMPPAALVGKPVTLTDAATITLDASHGSNFRVTLGGNRTLAAPTNPTDGQRITLLISQDATGSRTLTWNAVYSFGTITNALTTTASRRDLFEFSYNAAVTKWLVVNASKNLT